MAYCFRCGRTSKIGDKRFICKYCGKKRRGKIARA